MAETSAVIFGCLREFLKAGVLITMEYFEQTRLLFKKNKRPYDIVTVSRPRCKTKARLPELGQLMKGATLVTTACSSHSLEKNHLHSDTHMEGTRPFCLHKDVYAHAYSHTLYNDYSATMRRTATH